MPKETTAVERSHAAGNRTRAPGLEPHDYQTDARRLAMGYCCPGLRFVRVIWVEPGLKIIWVSLFVNKTIETYLATTARNSWNSYHGQNVTLAFSSSPFARQNHSYSSNKKVSQSSQLDSSARSETPF